MSKLKVQDKDDTDRPAVTVTLEPVKGTSLCGTGMIGNVP